VTLGLQWAGAWLVGLLVLAGCATPQRSSSTAAPGSTSWSGRMALQVEDNASQSFSAGFELRGTAASGELSLFNPLGGTVAVLAWAPGAASLRSNGEVRRFDSVQALAEQATGAPIPVAALFDWLDGKPTAVAGWQPDLSQLQQGRLRARRTEPPPALDLRIAFDR
jgi:outer membrane lipoprotein LolB